MRLLLSLFVGTVALIAAGAGASTPAAGRILDKTLICTHAGDVDVMASPRGDQGFATARTISSGYLGVNSGPIGALSGIVFLRARAERGIQQTRAWPQGIYARAGKCFLSRKPVPLSSRGLPGPPVAWSKSYGCTPRGRLLLRVRAVLAAPAAWHRVEPSFFGVRTNVVSATLAVREERTGKAVAVATLDRAGRTKLWVAEGCS